VPGAPTIYGASKLTGRLGEGWTIGTLQAVTARNEVQVQLADGTRARRPAEPLTSFNAVRIKRELGDEAYVGLTGTAVAYAESSDAYPLSSPTTQLCPNAIDTTNAVRTLNPALQAGPLTSVPAQARCFNNAYVAGADWQWRFGDGDWVTAGQVVASQLQNGSPRLRPGRTGTHPGGAGTGVVAFLNKEGGKHWVGDVNGEYNDRKLDVNDMGYDRRANNYRWRADLEYRELDKWWIMLESHARLEYFDRYNLD